MIYLISAKYVEKFEVELIFNTNESAIVDLFPYLQGDVFEPLQSVEYFKTLTFNKDTDTICWDNGADFAPEFLYEISLHCRKVI